MSSFLVHYGTLLQNVTDIKKCDSYFITKYDKSLLQICASECVCVCVCVCVCLFVQRPLLFPYNGGRMRVLSSISKADQADFTDWMSFLPSNLMEEINSNTKALNANT